MKIKTIAFIALFTASGVALAGGHEKEEMKAKEGSMEAHGQKAAHGDEQGERGMEGKNY